MTNINPNSHHFSQEDRKKIKHLIDEGVKVQREVEAMKEGLSDVVKDLSKEMDIPVSTFNKAIRAAHKGDLRAAQEEIELIEELVEISGRRG